MTENDEVVVTNGHVASVARAVLRDASGLTPETVGEDAMARAATILAHMDELDRLSPHGAALMLAIVDDSYGPAVAEWAKVTYGLADGGELRSANRLVAIATYGARARQAASEAWKRRVGAAA
jgi:hypothetical protein